ncbi:MULTISPECIES: hypothetical protein [unclassified Thiocapsa]|uniref:hypothetical protein n=1 Tax=unclassified Thiocapsa TaxID=2641286 RepID=UPI0035B104E7
MRTFRTPTKLLVMLALCPSFADAEGLWNLPKAEAGFGTRFWPDEALNAPAPVGNN